LKQWEDLGRQLQQSGKTDQIKKLAQSEDGARLTKQMDTAAVEAAVRSGDSEAMRRLLGQILSTDEGKRLAEQVKQIMKD